MQTNRSLRNVVTRGDCECHAKLGDDFLFAPEALLTNARSAFKSSLLREEGGAAAPDDGRLYVKKTG